MLPIIKYNLTNWVDGMKISKNHFVNSEHAIQDQIRDTNALIHNRNNYGLLAPLPGESSSLSLEVINGNLANFKISLSHCRAITLGGNRIEIIAGQHQTLANETMEYASQTSNAYLVVVLVNPFERMPHGEASPEDYPPRNQFVIPNYELHVVPEESMNMSNTGANLLPVARLENKNGDLVLDLNYIAPCTTSHASQSIKALNNQILDILSVAHEHSIGLVQKIQTNNQTTPLAKNVEEIAKQSANYIASNMFAYNNILLHQSPVNVADFIYRFISLINTSIDMIPNNEKEEMVGYFAQWCEVPPSKLTELLSNALTARYAHENMQLFFKPAIEFLIMWRKLLDALSKLKLIGDRGGNIFGSDRTQSADQNSMFAHSAPPPPQTQKSIFDR